MNGSLHILGDVNQFPLVRFAARQRPNSCQYLTNSLAAIL